MITRQSGTIKWFDQSKGHGWITPETGHDTNAPLHFFLCLKNPRGYQGVTIRAFPRRLQTSISNWGSCGAGPVTMPSL
ncbi:hypothetical protein AAIH16_44675, partial [Pseudomonas aeruginosa]